MQATRPSTSPRFRGLDRRPPRSAASFRLLAVLAMGLLAVVGTARGSDAPVAVTARIRAGIEAGRLQVAIDAGRELARYVLSRVYEDVRRRFPTPPEGWEGWTMTRFVPPTEDPNLVFDAVATFQADYRGPDGAEVSVRLEGRRGAVARDLTRSILEAPAADRFDHPRRSLHTRGRWGTTSDGRQELLLRQVFEGHLEHDDYPFVRITGGAAMRREEVGSWGTLRVLGLIWGGLVCFSGETTLLTRISRSTRESLERIDTWLETPEERRVIAVPSALRRELLSVLRRLALRQGQRFTDAVRPAVADWPPVGASDHSISWTLPITRHVCSVLALRGPIFVTAWTAPGAPVVPSGVPSEEVALSNGTWRRSRRSGGADVAWEIAVPGTAWFVSVAGDDRDGTVRAAAQRLSLERVAEALR